MPYEKEQEQEQEDQLLDIIGRFISQVVHTPYNDSSIIALNPSSSASTY